MKPGASLCFVQSSFASVATKPERRGCCAKAVIASRWAGSLGMLRSVPRNYKVGEMSLTPEIVESASSYALRYALEPVVWWSQVFRSKNLPAFITHNVLTSSSLARQVVCVFFLSILHG